MATFIWDPAVAWPPPAHILLNYDVIGPGDPLPLAGRKEGERSVDERIAALEAAAAGWAECGRFNPPERGVRR
jgi:hypothetical protein